MDTTVEKYILAIVTTNKERVASSGSPIFIAKNTEEMQRITFLLEKILDGIAHDLEIGTMIIVRH